MRQINYIVEYPKLLTPEIVSYLTQIHDYKGMQSLFLNSNKEVLDELLEIAKIQSTEASNRIEGIVTSDERLKKILKDKTTPKNREECEISGYRDVLSTIHENYDFILINPNMILQLYGSLYKFSNSDSYGTFKKTDNVIKEIYPDGTEKTRFEPVSVWETESAMENICGAYQKALKHKELDPLLLIPMFILDFLCIHPFDDGNGRMSRLLTLLLLYRSDYIVGKYISIERLIATSKENYYNALENSSVNWHEACNDYIPFVRYMLGVIIAAYRDFAQRADILIVQNLSKSERIRKIISEHLGKITKAKIIEQCPDISSKTVERTLKELLDNQEIIKIGTGRYTYYKLNENIQ
ncbi:Fic family protein [bacterium]|nr:Fic family protein [bacterium]